MKTEPFITVTFTESSDVNLNRAVIEKQHLGLTKANHMLAHAAWSAPKDGAYDKTEVVIHDGNGWTYTARIDLTREMHGGADDVIGIHLRNVVSWANCKISEAMTYGGTFYSNEDGSGKAADIKESAIFALGLLTFTA